MSFRWVDPPDVAVPHGDTGDAFSAHRGPGARLTIRHYGGPNAAEPFLIEHILVGDHGQWVVESSERPLDE